MRMLGQEPDQGADARPLLQEEAPEDPHLPRGSPPAEPPTSRGGAGAGREAQGGRDVRNSTHTHDAYNIQSRPLCRLDTHFSSHHHRLIRVHRRHILVHTSNRGTVPVADSALKAASTRLRRTDLTRRRQRRRRSRRKSRGVRSETRTRQGTRVTTFHHVPPRSATTCHPRVTPCILRLTSEEARFKCDIRTHTRARARERETLFDDRARAVVLTYTVQTTSGGERGLKKIDELYNRRVLTVGVASGCTTIYQSRTGYSMIKQFTNVNE